MLRNRGADQVSGAMENWPENGGSGGIMSIHGGDIYRNEGVLDFSANCNCYGMPEAVRLAAVRGVECAVCYPDPGCEALREAVAGYEGVEPEQVLCGNGASELLTALVRAICPKKALLLAPGFYGYERALLAAGSGICRHELSREAGFLPGEPFLEELSRTSADCVIFSNPHNPTGRVLEPDYLERLVGIAQARGIRLIVDECFLGFLKEPERYSCKRFLAQYEGVLVLNAFTKTFACAGLRIGYLIGSSRKMLDACRLQLPEWNVSLPATYAGIAATRCGGWLEECAAKIRAEREWLRARLEELGFQVVPGEADFLFFSGRPGLFEHCLRHKILIRDCGNYRGLSSGTYRVCVKKRDENEKLLRVLGMRAEERRPE